MTRRERTIARSVVFAMLSAGEDGRAAREPSLARALRVFYLHWVALQPARADLFAELRRGWGISEAAYRGSFDARKQGRRGAAGAAALLPLGDMGYSGSTFYRTSDGAYLVKSVPRAFEHRFFRHRLLAAYADHVRANGASLLVRITDFLEAAHRSLGTLLGLAPTHHIVMENLMHGREGEGEGEGGGSAPRWESWDLKPASYFFPERDVAGGALASEATKSKLPDEFRDKLRVSAAQAAAFARQLENDTRLLADCGAVDYSLFLVRVSAASAPGDEEAPPPPPLAPPSPPSWRTGIVSRDGREVYRAAILDFFWSKHAVHAKAMTGLVRSYDVVAGHGPMTITADSSEYRDRFLKMCSDIVEVRS
ncbi:SAICAR synthase-like protein [Durotheca rogersii]|uniref:SAICAR synthase-like protein n=1 Tax=Durotheca rogersii TaxID=419775 RepID=UPI00221EE488|nr:SAICAR synthase-like protein [Durotheca rogersii]KAI5859782.1 SAICAR synthase-like protein [Durotheca rogersii]